MRNKCPQCKKSCSGSKAIIQQGSGQHQSFQVHFIRLQDLIKLTENSRWFDPFESKLIFTVRKRSCGKVMFSQACVKNSVHGRRCTHPQADPPLDKHPQANTPSGRTPPPSRRLLQWMVASYRNAFLF